MLLGIYHVVETRYAINLPTYTKALEKQRFQKLQSSFATAAVEISLYGFSHHALRSLKSSYLLSEAF